MAINLIDKLRSAYFRQDGSRGPVADAEEVAVGIDPAPDAGDNVKAWISALRAAIPTIHTETADPGPADGVNGDFWFNVLNNEEARCWEKIEGVWLRIFDADKNPTDSDIGEKAFKNPPSGLSTQQKTAVRTAIGAGTGGGSGGGLTSVSTDDTLTGAGTSEDLLKVANPFTDADESKLDAIASGAQVNPTDSQIGEKAFKNPPAGLSTQQKTAVRTAIGAGTGGGTGGGGSTVVPQSLTQSGRIPPSGQNITLGATWDLDITAIGNEAAWVTRHSDNRQITFTKKGTYRLYGQINVEQGNRTGPSLSLNGSNVTILGWSNPYSRDAANSEFAAHRSVDFLVAADGASARVQVVNRLTSPTDSSSGLVTQTMHVENVTNLRVMPIASIITGGSAAPSGGYPPVAGHLGEVLTAGETDADWQPTYDAAAHDAIRHNEVQIYGVKQSVEAWTSEIAANSTELNTLEGEVAALEQHDTPCTAYTAPYESTTVAIAQVAWKPLLRPGVAMVNEGGWRVGSAGLTVPRSGVYDVDVNLVVGGLDQHVTVQARFAVNRDGTDITFPNTLPSYLRNGVGDQGIEHSALLPLIAGDQLFVQLRGSVDETVQIAGAQSSINVFRIGPITAPVHGTEVFTGWLSRGHAASNVDLSHAESTHGEAPGAWVLRGIPDDGLEWLLWWAVPTAFEQPAKFTIGGIDVSEAVRAPVARTIGAVEYQIYLVVDEAYAGPSWDGQTISLELAA